MLEIILLLVLTRKVGRIAAEKGRKRAGYMLMTVVLWISCEFTGAIIGASVSSDFGIVLIFTLIGAVAGAVTSYLIVSSLSSIEATEVTAGYSNTTSELSKGFTESHPGELVQG